jgi:hypothetical protein
MNKLKPLTFYVLFSLQLLLQVNLFTFCFTFMTAVQWTPHCLPPTLLSTHLPFHPPPSFTHPSTTQWSGSQIRSWPHNVKVVVTVKKTAQMAGPWRTVRKGVTDKMIKSWRNGQDVVINTYLEWLGETQRTPVDRDAAVPQGTLSPLKQDSQPTLAQEEQAAWLHWRSSFCSFLQPLQADVGTVPRNDPLTTSRHIRSSLPYVNAHSTYWAISK